MINSTAIGLLFSGQGAQTVGMGKSFYDEVAEIKPFWDKANEVLGYDLAKLVFEGPEEALTETKICQPALYVHGYTTYRSLVHLGHIEESTVKTAMGLSLGELTALAAAGVYDFETGLQVVAKRGELMQQACESTQGGMTSLIGGSLELVQELCKEFDIDMANFNSPGQIVISGEKDKVTAATAKAPELGFKRAIPLKVAGAYHSRLMQTAADEFSKFLADIDFSGPKIPVFSNVNGKAAASPNDLKAALVKQVTSSVLWVDCMNTAHALEVQEFVECGPGKVLKGLAKRTNPAWIVHSVSEKSDVSLVES